MSETIDADKQSIKHQVGSMYKSVIAQEKLVTHLRSLHYQDASDEQIQDNTDLLEEVLTARKELVERIDYLEVAYDYDWDAAKVYLEMKEANPSSIVLKAVTEAKKRKAAGKKDGEDKKKKREDSNNNSTSNSSSNNSSGPSHRSHGHGANNAWRSSAAYAPQQSPYPFYGWQGGNGAPQPYYGSYASYAPAAPYNRQANQFRPPRPPGCFNCGKSSHGFRRCPNMAAPPPPPPPKPPATNQ